MTFGHPEWLLLLAVPVLLAAWELTRRYPRVALPFDHGSQRPGRWLGRFVSLAGLLPAALLAVAILIFCRPLKPGQPRQERKLTNIEFVLDVSGSMESQFGEGSRYDAAMAAIEDFTSRRKGDAFGLTIFGNEVLRWTPLTKDLSAIRHATPFLRPELLPRHFGGTEIGKALRFCGQTLPERGEGDRMIILLSDGRSADLGGPRARQIGAELAEDLIVLYAIHIGGGPAPGDLYELSRPTKGQVFAADNPDALATVFGHIDRMQPVKLEPAAPQQVDAFGPFAVAGLVVLGLLQTALFGLRYTPW
jgi:Ca-activated chloride channel family protein